jgi:outer membrane lipoprotein SlyB
VDQTMGSEGEIQRRGTDKRRAIESAAIGAGVGAAAGAAAGGGKGAAIGAAAGGALGGGAGILTDRDLVLNKGTQLELTLDRQLQVPN